MLKWLKSIKYTLSYYYFPYPENKSKKNLNIETQKRMRFCLKTPIGPGIVFSFGILPLDIGRKMAILREAAHEGTSFQTEPG